MIDSLCAKNYKSFEELSISISNINILLGSNSCGKSSITNLLLMLSQTADTYGSYDSILRLNGDKSSLGESINIFPDKKVDKNLELGWSLTEETIEEVFKQFYFFELYDEVDNYLRVVAVSLIRNQTVEKDYYHRIMMEVDQIFGSVYTSRDLEDDVEKAQKLKGLVAKILKPMLKLHRDENSKKNRYQVKRLSIPRLYELIDFLIAANQDSIKPKAISYTVGYSTAQQECELKQIAIFNKSGGRVIDLRVSSSRKIDLYSDIIPKDVLERSRLDIVRGMDLKSLVLLDESFTVNCKNPFASYIRSYVCSVLKTYSSEIAGTKLNHVSPLRAFPQRYYLLEKSAQHNTLSSNDGSQLAEVLKNNPIIMEKVNDLFEDFGIKISTAKTNDIIHRITVKQNNVTVELTDVGFGISQVLPVLVQALLCPKNSLTIIEQPEIHLHPRMQAWLTNALVYISIEESKKFIIETHSDTVIKRLQMLLLDPQVKFSRENLNIYHLERTDSGKTNVRNVYLNEIGEISWPKGFMDMEINDAIELQKLKVKKIKEMKEVGNV